MIRAGEFDRIDAFGYQLSLSLLVHRTIITVILINLIGSTELVVDMKHEGTQSNKAAQNSTDC